jgi:hypothetical protein
MARVAPNTNLLEVVEEIKLNGVDLLGQILIRLVLVIFLG